MALLRTGFFTPAPLPPKAFMPPPPPPPTMPPMPAPSQVGYPYKYNWQPWPQPPFVYLPPEPVQCGHINDPYCPNRTGTMGLPDIYGYPTCCCPRSGNCHTPAVVPVGDPPIGVVTFPLGPYVLGPPGPPGPPGMPGR